MRSEPYRRWSRERIIAAIQKWVKQKGEIPRKSDWDASYCRLMANAAFDKAQDWLARAAEYESSNDYPPARVVDAEFGSWNGGIREAGFEPRAPGQHTRRGSTPSPVMAIFGHVVTLAYKASYLGDAAALRGALLLVARTAERLACGLTADELTELEMQIRDDEARAA